MTVFWMGEHQANPFIACPSGTSGAVGIEVEVVRDVKMEDVGDVIDINAPCGNVRGDQNTQPPVAEALHDPVALCLIKVTVYSICFEHLLKVQTGCPCSLLKCGGLPVA